MSDTPRTDALVDGIQARMSLRGFFMPEDLSDLHDKCKELERELSAALKDAERYRRLRECVGPVCAGIEMGSGDVQWLDTTDLDAAIDAAIEKGNP